MRQGVGWHGIYIDHYPGMMYIFYAVLGNYDGTDKVPGAGVRIHPSNF